MIFVIVDDVDGALSRLGLRHCRSDDVDGALSRLGRSDDVSGALSRLGLRHCRSDDVDGALSRLAFHGVAPPDHSGPADRNGGLLGRHPIV